MHTRFRLPAPPRAVKPTRRRPVAALALGMAGALLLGGGITVLNPGGTPAHAAESGPALTVKWVGDTGPAKAYQPARKQSSVHYGDFDRLSVTVSQNRELTDQRIRIDVSGMPGATGAQKGTTKRTATNYMQAMQCWGDPADPGFRETCQWGGHYVNPSSTINDMMPWNRNRSGGQGAPFRTVWNEVFPEKANPQGQQGYVYNQLFTGDTSNEVLAARMSTGGRGWFNFETQTSDAAPHLGCGLPTAANGAGERCWLVLVPRGEHHSETDDFTTDDRQCRAGYGDNIGDPRAQVGSPLDPTCDYWDNRMVVPLDFLPTGATCPPGVAERPVAGADTLTAAVSSWQPALCANGATYSYASLSDSGARDQLLSGQGRFALTGLPLTARTVSEDLADGVDDANLVYAPIAITAPAIGFLVTTFETGRFEKPLNLSPRIIAKLLTQSYRGTVPIGDDGLDFFPEHIKKNRVAYVEDPEFEALNAELIEYLGGTRFSDSSHTPGLIVAPTASDANAQLWRWIQADEKARAFLNGAPDNVLPGDEANLGIVVNPNYLPKGHPDATLMDYVEVETISDRGTPVWTFVAQPDKPRIPTGLAHDNGTPYSLADTPLDTLPRADSWIVPRIRYDAKQRHFDTTQWNQPRGSLQAVATDIVRRTPKVLAEWDPLAYNAAGEVGAWVAKRDLSQGDWIMIGLSSTSNAERYALDSARLQVPNQPGVFVAPDNATMLAALGAASDTGVPGVTQVDPAKAGAGAYPLTQVMWGAMRLDGSTPDERRDYAAFIEQVTTTGQTPGTAIGQLPPGYAPLTEELRAKAAEAVKKIRAYTDPTEAPPVDAPDGDTPTPPGDGAGLRPPARGPEGSNNIPVNPDDLGTSLISGGPNVTPGGTPDEAGLTETNAPSGFTGLFSALGGLLLLGASGAVAVPGLLRRRDTPLL